MLFRNLLLVSLVALLSFSTASAEDAKPAAMSMEGMSYPMQKSMDPQVWMQMMTMMMDPAKGTSIENCALCHKADDLARYAKDFGPMMNSMQSMSKSFAPHTAMQQMNPMTMMGSMGGMMNPMMGMMNPMTMMGPMMGMMNPMMGMMNPMTMMGSMGGMMNPMTMMGSMGGMMNPMTMMGPMGGMMNPMTMMGPMGGMMNPMGMMGGANNANNANPMGQMMKPEQYTDWFNQMMKSFTPDQAASK